MNEVKTTVRRMGFYYLLLAVSIITCANVIPDSFPTRNASTIYLLVLSSCLIFYYSYRVSPSGRLSVIMKSVPWLGLMLILLRGIKYSAFARVGVLARHTWYLYYVPMMLIPLFLFYISLLVFSRDDARIRKRWLLTLAVTVVFIVLILTNDFHQLIFRFKPDFINWDGDYSYGLLFYVILLWRYALYIAAIAVLIGKCRIVSSKKSAWITLVPFLIGFVFNLLLITGTMPKINGTNIFEIPETIVFTVAIVLECCMQLGLIPTNTNYGKLFQNFSIAAQITDKKGTPVYSSSSAVPLTTEQFYMQNDSRIGEHIVLHKMEIPGGFGFWQDDMTELDRLNEELAEAKEDLAQEAELIRLRNELKEKQTKIEQRTLVYDTIAKRTQSQSQSISRLAETARLSEDAALKEECRSRITMLCAYIKRYANLMLLSQESGVIEIGELGLSVSEVLRYLNFSGIPSEFLSSADGTVSAGEALAVFEAVETLLETNFPSLRGAFVNLSVQEEKLLFKLTLENPTQPISDEMIERLSFEGVLVEAMTEDDVAYICFALTKGGETL